MENSERCYNCRNLQRYYTRGVKSYLQTDFGYCCECRAVVEVHHSCEKFVRRTNRRRSERLTRYYLNDILTEISEIRKVLEGEQAEKAECNFCNDVCSEPEENER
ncbi:MAG TPA: hypothetical protein IAB64_01035 [Candidatus Coproplasma excrementavium]|nr:hypothetical protein [Candidatus Coproplasma excrementavium]